MTNLQLTRLVKRLRDLLRTDPGVDGDAQRLAQISWMLFFRAISSPHSEHWNSSAPTWTAYRDRFALQPHGAVAYTNTKLLPALAAAKLPSLTLRQTVQGFTNHVSSDEVLAELITVIDCLPITGSSERHLVGDLYEQLLASLQNAGTAGEFYTPRALTKLLAEIIDPKNGEALVDPASGTGGFLVSALERARSKGGAQIKLHAYEKKPLPHLLCATNLLLHGYDSLSGIKQRNVLGTFDPTTDSGLFDALITNPPFGGEEEPGVSTNFPAGFQTKDTALLFLLYAMSCLKPGGRAAIILPDGFLFAEGIASKVRQKMLKDCNVHTVIRLPPGVFAPYTGIRTNVLLFEKGHPTELTWFYHHQVPEQRKTYSKTKPIEYKELAHLVSWSKAGTEREKLPQSHSVSIEELAANGYSLDVRAPASRRPIIERTAPEYLKRLEPVLETALEFSNKLNTWTASRTEVRHLVSILPHLSQTQAGIETLRRACLGLAMSGNLSNNRTKRRKHAASNALLPTNPPSDWQIVKLGELGRIVGGATPRSDNPANFSDEGIPWLTPADLRNNRSKYARKGRRDLSEVGFSSCSVELLPAGTVLFSSRAPIGYVAIAANDLCTNQGFKSLAPDDPKLSDFLYYFLKFAAPEVDRNAPGTTFKEVSGSRVKQIDIWMPGDTEREEVVRKLDDLVELSYELERLCERAQETYRDLCNIT